MPRPSDHFFPDPSRLAGYLGELRLKTPTPFDREPDLLATEPIAASKMAAIVLVSNLLLRRSWSKVVEVSERELTGIPVGSPAGAKAFAKREHRFRLGEEPLERGRCTHCPIRPGFGPCSACVGTGTLFRQREGSEAVVPVPCGCDAGFAPCRPCDATGESVRVTVHHATDEPFRERRVVVPSLVGALDDVVRGAIESIPDIPDAFRIELEPTVMQSAYRGATGVEKPDFYGYDFLDGWERARAALKSVQGTVLRTDESFAWPFLCLRWNVAAKDVDVGIVPMPDGSWRAVFPS